MKGPLERTKVVVRRLPPSMTQQALVEQIDCKFSGRYKWLCFRPGKNNQKSQRCSRVYIDFNGPEDVLEFSVFFGGHTFVNEKGIQFKATVEYAPSQHVPKPCPKKDGREGTIFKDPEYMEFLELLAKPVENLPSAEIQLERREAERAGGAKEALIVTPLMNFVRQKMAAKVGSQVQWKASCNGKLSRRAGGVSASSSSASSKHPSGKRRVPTMYVLKDSTKGGSGKDKSAYILLPRKEEQKILDKSAVASSSSGAELVEDGAVTDLHGIGMSGSVETGKRRLVLLKGKEKEISQASGDLSQQQIAASSVRDSPLSTSAKQNKRHDTSGRIIRSILSNKEGHQSQTNTAGSQSERQMQIANLDDKRLSRPSITRPTQKDRSCSSSLLTFVSDSDGKRNLDGKVIVNDLHGSASTGEKYEKRTRNKDRPDRGVWTPLHRSEGATVNDGTLSSSVATLGLTCSSESGPISQQVGGIKVVGDDKGVQNAHVAHSSCALAGYDMLWGPGESKTNIHVAIRGAETKNLGGGKICLSSTENGLHRLSGRRGTPHGLKEVDGTLCLSDGKPSKRGPSNYGSHEKQVWVQKSGSAS